MEFTNAAWLQQPQIPELHPTPDGQHPASDDWKEPSASTQPGPGAASVQPTLDLSEFGLGDLSAPSSSTSSIPSSAAPFFQFSSHSFYLPTTPGPYNAVAYGSAPWPSSSNQLPLSSYSSLNGATSTSSSSGQQSPPLASTMVIDPALTTMNGSASPPMQQYQHSPPFLSSQPQQRTPHYQYQHQPPPLSINPSYTHFQHSSIPFIQPGSQHSQHQQQQGTLSPYVLHSPTNTLASSLPPSSFYGTYTPAPSIPTVTPEQKKANFLTAIRPLLAPTSFTGAGAVSQLVGNIDDYGTQDVDPGTRFEILTKMRDNAGNHYFRAWVENEVAMEITREWLKLAYAGKSDPQLIETIMPLLHIIDRLPLTIETLKSSKLGKIVVKLVKEPPAPAIKDMASNLERKWRQILASNSDDSSKRMDTDGPDDTKGKKRKADPPASKAGPPAKKAALCTPGSSSSRPVSVKREAKSVVREVKDAKSDSSFFSAPKPKPKLPSFKKAPPAPVKKEPDMNVAQPSSINPFEEALKSMAKSRKDSPATSTPPPAAVASSTPVPTGLTSSGKRKKSVTWAPEGKLEMVKLIERAIYDDDPADGMPTHNIRDLDRDEGAALHAHLFEEQIEWFEPIPVDIPGHIDLRPRGEESTEKDTQEQREQAALVALYTTAAQIPESPAEPPSQIPEEQVDEDVKLMLTGPEVDMVFWNEGAPAAVEPPKSSVAELVGQLAAGAADIQMADAAHVGQQPFDFKAFGVDLAAPPQFSHLSPQQVQQLMQHAQALQQGGMFAPGSAAGQSAQGTSEQNWTAGQYTDYERGGFYEDGRRDRGWSEESGGWNDRGGSSRGRYRGGRGKGRGDGFRSNKRKPCSFFAAGRCRYGDQCDFSHEPIY
ncbi:hypothetical protein B0H21DRAFT_725032 [Amylocystis lapponica]|nr:hypothetical protein B0H21DRAFT_725032 [Amylocystis lapponica]